MILDIILVIMSLEVDIGNLENINNYL